MKEGDPDFCGHPSFLFASRNAEALPKHLALIMRCFTFVQHDVWKFLIGTLMGPDCFYIRSAGKIFSLPLKDLDTLPQDYLTVVR